MYYRLRTAANSCSKLDCRNSTEAAGSRPFLDALALTQEPEDEDDDDQEDDHSAKKLV